MKHKLIGTLALLLLTIVLASNQPSAAQSAIRKGTRNFVSNMRAMALPEARMAVLSRPYLPEVSTSSVDIDICDMPFTRSNGGWGTSEPDWSGSPAAATASPGPNMQILDCPIYSSCSPAQAFSTYSCSPASSCVSVSGCGISIGGCGGMSSCDTGSFYCGTSCGSSCATSCPWSLGGL